MSVRIQKENFDFATEVANLYEGKNSIGAVVTFLGLVRDLNEQSQVQTMMLEHYPGMTEKALNTIVAEAKEQFAVEQILVIHRIGLLRPNDQIVLVAVTSSHRGAAFDACEFVIDYLKTKAPFWKWEETPTGGGWVDARESDDRAAEKWQST